MRRELIKRFLCGLVLALVALSVPMHAVAVGTVTTTSTLVSNQTHVWRRYTVSWTSSAGGAVSGNAFTIVAGALTSIRFIPNLAATQPTDLYDVTLTDGGVTDLLSGQGANLSNASSAVLSWDPLLVMEGTRTLDVVVANAGNAKTGQVVILVQVR